MVYGLCGLLKSDAVCMKKVYTNILLTYFKRFLKFLVNETIVNSDSYSEYRRRRTVDGINV
jgi:hypothetical protein